MRSKSRRQPIAIQGFTLVELMIALVILAVGILGVGQIFAVSGRNAAMGRAETTAVSLAREIQEKIMSESVDQVPMVFDGVDTTEPSTVTLPCEEWAAHISEQLGPGASGRLDVFDSDSDEEILPGMFSVLVRISWPSRGDTLTLPLRFAITDIGH